MKSLADQNRLRMLMVLRSGPMNVGEIREVLGLSMSTVSRHLAVLREAGFIVDERKGKWTRYSLPGRRPKELAGLLEILTWMLSGDRTVRHDRITAGTAAFEKLSGRRI